MIKVLKRLAQGSHGFEQFRGVPEKGIFRSVHTLGQASDILISGERAMLMFEKARQIGFSGIGLSQRGDHAKRFVHLDTKPRKALWSY